jgi:PadR family transcriptional regulator, regulatory protein PadR
MAVNKELLKGTAKTLVLQLLSENEMHGYELLSQLKEKSKNLIEITEGTLYPLLHSLEEDGLKPAGKKVMVNVNVKSILLLQTGKNL